jgi:hypothetical protein
LTISIDYLQRAPKILYETAKRNLTRGKPEEHDKLLKALLLEEIIQIGVKPIQVEFLAEQRAGTKAASTTETIGQCKDHSL